LVPRLGALGSPKKKKNERGKRRKKGSGRLKRPGKEAPSSASVQKKKERGKKEAKRMMSVTRRGKGNPRTKPESLTLFEDDVASSKKDEKGRAFSPGEGGVALQTFGPG